MSNRTSMLLLALLMVGGAPAWGKYVYPIIKKKIEKEEREKLQNEEEQKAQAAKEEAEAKQKKAQEEAAAKAHQERIDKLASEAPSTAPGAAPTAVGSEEAHQDVNAAIEKLKKQRQQKLKKKRP